MDRETFNGKLKDTLNKIETMLSGKSTDYSGNENVFGNLMLCELMNLARTEKGMLIRMLDKVGRISNLLEQRSVCINDEKIEDTVLDLAGYAILLYIYLQRKNV